MILDNELMFCEDLAVTAAADATNVIDLGTARDLGIGEEMYIFLSVTETMDDASDDSTLQVDLVTDDNAALSSDTVVATLVTIPATTAAGTFYVFRVPPAVLAEYEQYLGLAFTPANGNLSAGKFTAGIVKDIQHVQNFASGFSIS